MNCCTILPSVFLLELYSIDPHKGRENIIDQKKTKQNLVIITNIYRTLW